MDDNPDMGLRQFMASPALQSRELQAAAPGQSHRPFGGAAALVAACVPSSPGLLRCHPGGLACLVGARTRGKEAGQA